MKKVTKQYIKAFMNRPGWNNGEIFWLLGDQSLGISRNGIKWKDDNNKERMDTWKNFQKKSSRKWDEEEIIFHLKDFGIFTEIRREYVELLDSVDREIKEKFYTQFRKNLKLFLKRVKAVISHKERSSLLIRIHVSGSIDALTYIIVRDMSTREYYILRVPPWILKCREAVAWTFGMTLKEYNPLRES